MRNSDPVFLHGGRAVRVARRTAAVGEQMVTAPRSLWTGWYHVTLVIDSASMSLQLYEDGLPVAAGPTTLLPRNLGDRTQDWLGRSPCAVDPYFAGSRGEFRIYDRALSAGEIRHLAGDR